MTKNVLSQTIAGLLAVLSIPCGAVAADQVDAATVDKLTAAWPNRPKLALHQMIFKYGLPQEATPMAVTWHDAGPFKRICIDPIETPHSFPKPHVDFLRHTIAMKVPSAKADELVAFDGSNTFSRTEGEISAKCDSEAHNVLTLNLIHDILEGKKTVAEARKAFDQNVVEDMAGKEMPYMKGLVFDPTDKTAPGADPDHVTIPGAPEPLGKKENKGDSEILTIIAAVDEDEILAAEEAEMRKVSPEVMEFARHMHQEHGMNIDETMKLGKKIDAPLTETTMTEKLRVKDAGMLAQLVPLNGDAFGKAYIAAQVEGHTEVLDTIDNDLLKRAENPAVKKHLTETREHVAMHLEMAKKIQSAQK